MDIGERVKKIRNEKGLSTYQLAEITGISQSSISKLENGKRKADNSILEKLAEALNVSTDRLTGDSVSSIIEGKLEETGMTLAEVSEKSNVPLHWLENIDSFIPGDMEFMLYTDDDPGRALEWDDTIGGYRSYEWISRVAEALELPASMLRAALARQEIPTYDGPMPTFEEVRKDFIEADKNDTFDKLEKMEELLFLLNENGQEKALDQVELLTKIPEYRVALSKSKPFTLHLTSEGNLKDSIHPEVNAARERTDIDVTDEMRKHDDDIMDDDSEWE